MVKSCPDVEVSLNGQGYLKDLRRVLAPGLGEGC